jgi:serine phosphatase RsbU (regulator of sigma subunit)
MAVVHTTAPGRVEWTAPAWDADREIQIARRVQSRLLPRSGQHLATLDCDGLMVPTGGVGGDYFDFITPGPGTLAMVIADVSGHGVPAALMMSTLHALLRGHYAVAAGDLGSRLESVNRLFVDCTDAGHYATLFVGEYEEASGRLRYANCGHPAPLLLRADGGLERLEATATVIGGFRDWTCATAERVLAPGDDLLLYSDGVTEAGSAAGALYGEDRLARTLRAVRGREPSAIAWSVVGDLRRFTGGRLGDDVTVVVARRRAGRE